MFFVDLGCNDWHLNLFNLLLLYIIVLDVDHLVVVFLFRLRKDSTSYHWGDGREFLDWRRSDDCSDWLDGL